MLDLSIPQHIGVFLLTWAIVTWLLQWGMKGKAKNDIETHHGLFTFAAIVALGVTLIL